MTNKVRSRPRRRRKDQKSGASGSTAPKRAKNLLLDAEAVVRGESYSREHGTTISRLVSDFLRSLPTPREPLAIKSPAVRCLLGIAAGGTADIEDYHEYLMRKYGRT